ncbi:hypothetical protein MMC29_005969, partial [Sticta canariensis]|nr:hypothetical protein [Sticta canariensis]
LASLEKATGGNKWEVSHRTTTETRTTGFEKLGKQDFSGTLDMIVAAIYESKEADYTLNNELLNGPLGLPKPEPLDVVVEKIVKGEKLQLNPLNPGTPTSQMTSSRPKSPQPGGPPSLAFHNAFWRSGSRTKAEALLNQATANILWNLSSPYQGTSIVDARSPAGHFRKRPQAQWAKHQYPVVDIAIIHVFVPKELLRRLSVTYIWFSEHWKRVLWHGRNRRRLPRELAQLEDPDLLIGQITSGKHCKYTAMKDDTQMKEGNVLPVEVDTEPKKAIQWVLQTRKAVEGFESMYPGKVHIHQLGYVLQ